MIFIFVIDSIRKIYVSSFCHISMDIVMNHPHIAMVEKSHIDKKERWRKNIDNFVLNWLLQRQYILLFQNSFISSLFTDLLYTCKIMSIDGKNSIFMFNRKRVYNEIMAESIRAKTKCWLLKKIWNTFHILFTLKSN
jgi:hypothetical protein